MRFTVLTDNLEGCGLSGEWGLSLYIETDHARILLDAGASGLFAENAEKLGLPLDAVDFGVLSHAHYDHADGFPAFFERNESAPVWIRASCAEGCMHDDRYIGIAPGLLDRYADRFRRVDGVVSPCEGVTLLPHTTPGLARIGVREGMRFMGRPDDFSHEQSLVIETPAGLAVFNSCSHGGASAIVREARQAFPGKPVTALVGGFHLYNKTDDEVRAFAEALREANVKDIYTGHCTGDRAFELLSETPGLNPHRLRTGLTTEIG